MRRPIFIARQAGQPSGLLGGLIARIMARETASDNDRAISLLAVQPTDRILDIGTGHGTSLGKLSELAPQGIITGIDHSDVMTAIASRRNAGLIRLGRIEIVQSPTDRMPFADASFDRAMAMHTLYFWQPVEPHFREIRRILRPTGTFVVGFRPADDAEIAAQLPAPVYALKTSVEVEAIAAAEGFSVIGRERRDHPGDSMVWLVLRKT